MKQEVHKFKCKCMLLIVAFVFYFYIASQIPYMHDDWAWGTDAGIRSFFTASQNSRYAGNLIVLAITRLPLLKNIVMATVFTAIPYMMVRVIGFETDRDFSEMYLLANMLILLMPTTIWCQTYGWVAGFANFVVSILVLLAHLLILKNAFFDETVVNQKTKGIAIALFAFAGQLFIENLAIYFCLVYFTALAFWLIKYKKSNIALSAAFVGVFAGLAVMFSSSVYNELFSTGSAFSGYRELTVGGADGIWGMVKDITKNFSRLSSKLINTDLYFPQTIMLLLCVMSLLLKRKGKFYALGVILNAIMLAISLTLKLAGDIIPNRYKLLFSFFFYVSICAEYIYSTSEAKLWVPGVFVWLSVYGVMMPLLVTNSYGGRLLITSYVLVSTFTVQIMRETLRHIPIRKMVMLCATTTLLLSVFYYIQVYTSIGVRHKNRIIAIEEAIDHSDGIINLEKYDYEEYLWNQDPVDSNGINSQFIEEFRHFYGIPDNYIICLTESTKEQGETNE